jgi:hypothetical protein
MAFWFATLSSVLPWQKNSLSPFFSFSASSCSCEPCLYCRHNRDLTQKGMNWFLAQKIKRKTKRSDFLHSHTRKPNNELFSCFSFLCQDRKGLLRKKTNHSKGN